MRLHTPGYYSKFRCLADKCPNTCCAWWEVPVDEASAAFYQSAPGELGDRLRAALTRDGEGEPCFLLTGGKCPFLDDAGLCSLQLEWGEEAIPAICREHPRFAYDYDGVREVGLCASCPECARLVLGEDLYITVTGDGGEGEEPLLAPLLCARERALELVGDATLPLTERLRAALLLANDVQNALDEEAVDQIGDVCTLYGEGVPQLTGVVLPKRGEALGAALGCLRELVILRPEWRALLDTALDALARGETLPLPPGTQGGRAAGYFLYRHWLRGLNDGDVLSWCELSVLGTAVAGALSGMVEGGFAEAFRLFCLETEHAQVNLDALQDALWHKLSLPQLLALA